MNSKKTKSYQILWEMEPFIAISEGIVHELSPLIFNVFLNLNFMEDYITYNVSCCDETNEW